MWCLCSLMVVRIEDSSGEWLACAWLLPVRIGVVGWGALGEDGHVPFAQTLMSLIHRGRCVSQGR